MDKHRPISPQRKKQLAWTALVIFVLLTAAVNTLLSRFLDSGWALIASTLAGAAAAMAVMAEAGEAAARLAEGPGSFLSRFLDALYLLDARHLEQRVFPA